MRPATGGSVRVEAGAVLFREGDPSDRAYLLERGEVEVSVERDGRRHVLCRKGPGELFGEMALVDGGRRCATVTAVTACGLVPITRERLLARLDQADPVLRLCLASLTNRLRWTIGHVQAADRPVPALPAEGAKAPAVLRGVLRLLRDLGLPAVAEGIERPGQASLLAGLGARYGQGFHFARPMPARAVEVLLADGRGKSPAGRRTSFGSSRPRVPAASLPREGAAAA